MRLVFRLSQWLVILSLLSIGVFGAPGLTKRIPAQIEDNQTYTLSGNTSRVVERGVAADLGLAAGSRLMPRLYLHFSLTAAQQADLTQLLHDQQDQRSPQFHQFLSLEQYADRFGMGSADLNQVTRWLEEQGFTDVQAARSRSFVSFSGTVAKTEAAFHTSIHLFSLRGEIHLANTSDPKLPKALEGIVQSIRGLHDFRWRSHIRSHFTAGANTHYLVPDDWTTIYDVKPLYTAGLDGTGVAIAVVGQSDVQLSDIADFRAAAGLPAKAPTVVMPSSDPGFQNGDEAESDLDLEWAGAIAKNANIVFVTSPYVQDSITYAIDNDVAPILATSYGSCEGDETVSDVNAQDSLYEQAGATGITLLASAGDDGATDCDYSSSEVAAVNGLSVDFPASSPFVTGVGGTTLSEGAGSYWSSTNNTSNGSALAYIPEVVWNGGFQDATGGGVSIYESKPYWQTGTGVPNDNARDVPDIAVAASPDHDAYLICGHNFCTNGFLNSSSNVDAVGGTSVGPPTMASMLALFIQQGGGGSLGLINPTLYSIAQNSPAAFHDITVGNNKMPCQTGTPDCPLGASPIGYSANTGYDQTTGLGSPDVNNLAAQFLEPFSIVVSPPALTISPGMQATSTITMTPRGNFTGTVSFACSVSGSIVGVTCSVPPTTLSAYGTTTVTITAASNAHVPKFEWPKMTWPRLHLEGWPWLLCFSLLLMIFLLIFVPKQQKVYADPLYAISSALFVIVAVGCGGGGTTASITGTTTPVTTPATLTLSCSLPGSAMPGMVYGGACTATGGTSPLAYSISTGALPAGLSLNASTGVVSGTPTAPGASIFSVKASDSGSPQQTATQMETIVVGPVALSLSCTLPSTVAAGNPYAGTCTGTGGTTPLTYSIVGSLPSGLSLNATNGVISGTPSAAGSSTFTVKVSDSGTPTQIASQMQTILVTATALTISCSLPGASVMAAYIGTCAASGGVAPVSYSISSGSLPLGLSINASTGAITGVPTAAGSSTFIVKAADSGSHTATQSGDIAVAAIAAFTFNPTLPGATAGTAYSYQFTAAGGNLPYSYAVSAGSLPAGLSLNSGSGLLSGTPTTGSTNSFTLTATDNSSPKQAVIRPLSFAVAGTAVVTVTATSGVFARSQTITVTVP